MGGRAPVSRRRGTPYIDAREAAWAVMRNHEQFTMDTLVRDTRENRVTIQNYVTALVKGGYLEITDGGRKSPGNKKPNRNHSYVYRITKDVGSVAPRVKSDGSPVTQGRGMHNMWRVIKVLNSFDFRELAIEASVDGVIVKPSTAREYVRHLKEAGYLQQVQKSTGGSPAQYRLIPSKFTGPRAPQIQKVNHVYDPNISQVVWPQECST